MRYVLYAMSRLVVALICGHVAAMPKRNEVQMNATKMLDALLEGYDNRQRPGFGAGPTVIACEINIRSMGPFSEADMTYSIDTYFRQSWKDSRLRLSGPQDSITLHVSMLEKIWKPDTYFVNGLQSYLHTVTGPNKLLRINKDGIILYSMRLTIKANCPMFLQNFPIDDQSCPLQFGSYAYTNDQVRYEWKVGNGTISMADGMRLSQFDLMGHPVTSSALLRSRNGDYSTLTLNFNLRRHMGYFVINVYVPCVLIVVLSWVGFWINREATPDRVGLGITTVLTLTTTSMDTRNDLPKVNYATALDWFVTLCFGYVIGTMLQFAGVHYFTKIGSGEFEDTSDAEDEADVEDEGKDKYGDGKDSGESCDDEEEETDEFDHSGNAVPPCNQIVSHQHLCRLCADKTRSGACPIPRAADDTPTTGRRRRVVPDTPVTTDPVTPARVSSVAWYINFWRCLRSDAKYRKLMRKSANASGVNSVSKIDQVSRILFPVSFCVLIFVYCMAYMRTS